MKSTSWRHIAELIGIGAIVASLIFVGLQLRQESDIAVRESRSDFVVSAIELARLFSDNREVWIKGLNAEELSEQETFTFDALVRVFYIDRLNRYERAKLSIASGDRQNVTQYVAFFLYQYPGLRRSYNKSTTKLQGIRDAFGSPGNNEFRSKISEALLELEANPPKLPEPDFIVF